VTAYARWSMAATLRLHCLEDGPCTPRTARYDLAGGGTVTVPLELPLGPPATAGRTVMMLPAPPPGSLVEHAALFAEDETELMEIRCDPPEAAGDSGTWQVAVAAPDLDAGAFADAPRDIVLHIGGGDYPCDLLRDPDHDQDGVAAYAVVPRVSLPASTEGMRVTAGTLPAGTVLVFCPRPKDADD